MQVHYVARFATTRNLNTMRRTVPVLRKLIPSGKIKFTKNRKEKIRDF